jgi:hypothetical protein
MSVKLERGYKLNYFAADDSVELKKYGEWKYDNLILFAPEAEGMNRICSHVSKILGCMHFLALFTYA